MYTIIILVQLLALPFKGYSQIYVILTYYGQYYNYKIKHVPGLLKIVLSEAKYLHDTLQGKYGDEHLVDIGQANCECGIHFVMFYCHGGHVHHNHRHNSNIKLLVCCQFEKEQLTFELRMKTIMDILLYICAK